jgi:hypothetical protein
MISEYRIRKDIERQPSVLIEVPSRHFLGGTHENKKNFIHDSRSPGRDSNQAPPGYKTEVSLLELTCSVDICDRRPKTIKLLS